MTFPHQIFCQVDDGLIDLIKSHAKGRTVVDVGCGVGLLGSKMPNVISLDINRRENPLIDNIIIMDALNFPFTEKQFPVFLRPCHGHFVPMILDKLNREDNVWDCLYVSKPENRGEDLAYADENGLYVTEVSGWTGAEGERAYHVEIRGEYRPKNLYEYWKIKAFGWRMPSWMEYDGSWLRNAGGGGFPYREGSCEVLEKAWVSSESELDWRGTGIDDPLDMDGWLDLDGHYWGCGSMCHDFVACVVFKCSSAHDAVDKGYIRIHARSVIAPHKSFAVIGEGIVPNEAQMTYLKERGIEHRFDMDSGDMDEIDDEWNDQ